MKQPLRPASLRFRSTPLALTLAAGLVLPAFAQDAAPATAAPPASSSPALQAGGTGGGPARGPAQAPARGAAPRGRSGAASRYPREHLPFTNGSLANLNPALPTLFVAGDSTAALNGNDIQRGWGAMLVDYFDKDKINLVNLGRGGASFPTYYANPWPQLVAAVKPGDFVIIEFGHNGGHLPGNGDEVGAAGGRGAPAGPNAQEIARLNAALRKVAEEADPSLQAFFEARPTYAILPTPPPGNRSFGWYIRQMAKEVIAKGGTPIISTPTVRSIWTNPNARFNESVLLSQNENYDPKDDKVERWMGTNGQMLEWTKAAVAQDNLILVDHSDITAQVYEIMGRVTVAKMFIQDRTHTTTDGATLNTETLIMGLKAVPNLPLNNYYTEKGKALPTYSPAGITTLPPAATLTIEP